MLLNVLRTVLQPPRTSPHRFLRLAFSSSAANMPIDTSARLAALREQLAHHNLTGYLVDSGDAHANEYTAPADDRRAWISGFTGSAGTAVVLKDQALLWTDGRYHQVSPSSSLSSSCELTRPRSFVQQASQQLSSDWTLFKHGLPQVPSWTEYLTNPSHSGSTFPRGSRLGLDPSLLSISDYQTLAPSLQSNGIELVPIRENLVDVAWDKEGDRPKRPKEEVLVLDEKYAGALNLRGSDIPYNPVFFAHLVLPTLSSSKATLFIDLDQVPQKTYDYLMSLDVLVEPYEALGEFCEGLSKVLGQEVSLTFLFPAIFAVCYSFQTSRLNCFSPSQDCVLLPPRISLSTALSLTLPFSGVIPNHKSPISNLKSIKNATELQGFRDCHIRDGVALVRYFSWLERALARGERLTEWEGAERLEEFRKQLPLFKGLSFSTISSTGANASVIHYSPSPTESAVIDKDQIYLCDSGAQFYDGTTE
ncbi:SPOSA6832_02697, partial [Sporobolomyces salmonicolor]